MTFCLFICLFVCLLHAQRVFFVNPTRHQVQKDFRLAGHPEGMPIQKGRAGAVFFFDPRPEGIHIQNGRFGAVRFFLKRFFAFFHAFHSTNSHFRSEHLLGHHPKLRAKNKRRKWSYIEIYRIKRKKCIFA